MVVIVVIAVVRELLFNVNILVRLNRLLTNVTSLPKICFPLFIEFKRFKIFSAAVKLWGKVHRLCSLQTCIVRPVICLLLT